MSREQNDQADDGFISKTQRKKQMGALQDLGRELLDLPNDKLKKIVLPEDLLTAIQEYKRINAHGARKRQEQYIGRLMRDIDPTPIQAALSVFKGDSSAHTAWLHQVERWRLRLLEDDQALPTFIENHATADVQQLRTLIRNARKEQLAGKPPKSFRLLFQAIKEIIPEPGMPATRTTDASEAQGEA